MRFASLRGQHTRDLAGVASGGGGMQIEFRTRVRTPFSLSRTEGVSFLPFLFLCGVEEDDGGEPVRRVSAKPEAKTEARFPALQVAGGHTIV